MVFLAYSTNQIVGLWYQLMPTEITWEKQQIQKYKNIIIQLKRKKKPKLIIKNIINLE